MDFFEQRYYSLLKLLLKITGHWPFQNRFHSWGFTVGLSLLGVSQIIPITIAVLDHSDDTVIFMEFVLMLILAAMLWAKGFAAKWSEPKIIMLLDRIRSDWQVWMHNPEVDILHVYAKQGQTMALLWAGIITSMPIIVGTQPVILKIIDILLKNGSKPIAFPIPLDYYYIDDQKYFFYIMAHFLLTLSLCCLHASSFNCMFIISVQHGCGIFAALGQKLSKFGKNINLSKPESSSRSWDKRNMDSVHLAWCIKRHHDAIELNFLKNTIKYVKLIEATFSWSFFITMGLNMLLISISGYQIAKSTNSVQEISKFVVIFTAGLGHIYVESYMAQILMDHSISIRHWIQCSKWYNLSPKVQMVLYMMMIRSNVPCTITIGKISILSLETFLEIFQSSMSCLTVLRSM